MTTQRLKSQARITTGEHAGKVVPVAYVQGDDIFLEVEGKVLPFARYQVVILDPKFPDWPKESWYHQ